jgi:hypothetical protein
LPILRAALRRVDAGEIADLEEIRQELGLRGMQMLAAIKALDAAGYVDASLTMGWSDDHASGGIIGISERGRRELGTWPSWADAFVEQLAAALRSAADAEAEPDRKGRLRAAADTLTGIGRDLAVHYVEKRLGL